MTRLKSATLAISFGAFVLGLAGLAIADDELAKLRGQWRLHKYVSDGEDETEEAKTQRKALWLFDPPMLRIKDRHGDKTFRITVDSKAVPKRFSLEYVGDNATLKEMYGGPIEGIYEIQGELLRRCMIIPGEKGPLPDNFDAGKGTGRLLIELERVKSESSLSK